MGNPRDFEFKKMKSKIPVLLTAIALLAILPAGLAGKRNVRPAAKGVKIGALGKDYVALTQPYSWSQVNPAGFEVLSALPRGVYKVKFEDDAGYYMPAPGKIGETLTKYPEAPILYDGGLYVKKNKPNVFYLYVMNSPTEFGEPDYAMPWEFPRHLRQ